MSLEDQLKAIPQKPGVYIYKDAKGHILYVGKAKKLSTRVRSYFRPNANLEPAKAQMVKHVATIETIATDTENEALVLEANLIRKHQPPYNVVLRDDKYYLFIKITTPEEFPRVFPVRKVKRDGARYFGPYSSAHAVRATLRLLRRLFPFKGEKDSPHDVVFPHPLFTTPSRSAGPPPPSKGGENKSDLLPLTKGESRGSRGVGVEVAEYQTNIQNIIRFLSGQREEIMKILRDGMEQASEDQHFERAATFRDQLQSIERLEGTQKVFLTTKESFDVVSLARTTGRSAANVFQIRGGKLLGKQTFLLQHRSEASSADTLRQFMLQYYSVAQDIPKKILVPEKLSDEAALAEWINKSDAPLLSVPERGKKRQLLEMGEMNAQELLRQEEIHFESETRLEQAQAELFKALGLAPHARGDSQRIEVYDISNIQGTLPTASMVVFENGQPKRSEYRKFRLKYLGAPNDFASLQQTLERRFSGRHPDWRLPDLMIIDGGKGQLSSVKKILDAMNIFIPTVALAKREEEIFLPGKPESLRLPYNSDALFLVQRMRDEAHRFTITYHRLLRSKRATRSILDDIPGIGPKSKKQLLQQFGSVKQVRSASLEALEEVLGKKKAELLLNYL